MTCFVDTAGLLALLDASDAAHQVAATAWKLLIESDEPLVTSSCVLVESIALAQTRLGIEAVRDIDRVIVPMLRLVWVDEELHRLGMAALLSAGRRKLSYVDCVSFVVMRRLRIERCFTFDRHFAEHGFKTV